MGARPHAVGACVQVGALAASLAVGTRTRLSSLPDQSWGKLRTLLLELFSRCVRPPCPLLFVRLPVGVQSATAHCYVQFMHASLVQAQTGALLCSHVPGVLWLSKREVQPSGHR